MIYNTLYFLQKKEATIKAASDQFYDNSGKLQAFSESTSNDITLLFRSQ